MACSFNQFGGPGSDTAAPGKVAGGAARLRTPVLRAAGGRASQARAATRVKLVASLLLLLAAGHCLAQADAGAAAREAEYDALIRSARDAGAEQALPRLDQLIALEPWNRRYLYDFVTVLHWAGRHAEAVRWWPIMRAGPTPAPAYALKALARSARETGFNDIALAANLEVIARDAGDLDAHLGAVLAYRDAARFAAARDHARANLPRSAGRLTEPGLPLARALAELLEAGDDALAAAALYQEILVLAPGDREAARRHVLLLADAGLPQLALQGVAANASLFSAAEVQRLRHDRGARLIQWGERQIAVDRRRQRFAATERALAANAALIEEAAPAAVAATEFDRLVALRDRVRMVEARALFVDLERRGHKFPAYVLSAAADAYLHLEQPDQARELYLRAIATAGKREPGMLFALFYAYVECEQHDLARQVADELLAVTPPIINRGLKGVELDNPDYPAAINAGVLQLIFSDRLDAAQATLAEARARAPFNFALRATQGTLLASRELPRASLAAFDALLIDDPDNLAARIGRAENLLTLKAFAAAGAELTQLAYDYPEHKGAQAASHKLTVHQSPLLTIDTTLGRSPAAGAAGPIAAHDTALDAHYYSSPIAEHYRWFTHLRYAGARISLDGSDRDLRRDRAGIGADLRRPGWEGRAELHAALGGNGANGIALALSHEFSDAWKLGARMDSNTGDLAWRAIGNRISARAASLEATHTVNESRNFQANLARQDYSDGNRRNSVLLAWRERWISGPVYKLSSIVSAGLSGNSRDAQSVPYFNPARDRGVDLALTNEWLTWRRYTRAFTQRLTLGIGSYGQSAAANSAVHSWRYEHEWTSDRRFNLRYGIGSSRHPYDGVQQTRNFLYLNLAWSPPW